MIEKGLCGHFMLPVVLFTPFKDQGRSAGVTGYLSCLFTNTASTISVNNTPHASRQLCAPRGVTFLHHLSIVRNLCAHHGRLWNREFTFKLPRHRPKDLVASLHPQNGRRIYNTLTTLAWLVDSISPDHHWKLRFKGLLEQQGKDTRPMGFPVDFSARPIGSAVWGEGK